ncbi:MAG: hypothetical protein A2622_03045 [Bdellovibrionales bacterium RIFCSPHIGHO2_01_FULL_40_29]|nr:MAG: hypothetical protein A2622_03045 [Bdellovibrionales bacterium RIFCSPHIGHO2_01_FULL_40_29]OFZ34051.1 MAG: hypothetical protein A3D17_03465 [Bdellovibrionales bacterium RIFCSPHIGHO2_02_FULL_40_15]
MELVLTRNEKLFAIIGLTVIGSFLMAFHQLNSKPRSVSRFESDEAINYQMGRPEEAFAGYSLDGREIDAHYEGYANKKKLVNATVKPTPVNAKNQKLAPAKKQLPVAAVKKPTAIPPIVKTHKVPSVHSNSDKTTLLKKSGDEFVNSVSATAGQNHSAAAPAPASHDEVDAKPENKQLKTFAQWRSDIFANPTKETLTLFITAFRKNEVSQAEYQAMAQDLVDQDDMNLKGLGLMALRAQPSLASLSQLVHAQETVPTTLQTYIEQAYLAYLLPQNIAVFNQVFQSRDKKLLLKSLSLLNTNIQKIRNGDTATFADSRQRRDGEASPLSVESFRTLLPSLLRLSAANNEISPMANQVAGMIQNPGAVAGL